MSGKRKHSAAEPQRDFGFWIKEKEAHPNHHLMATLEIHCCPNNPKMPDFARGSHSFKNEVSSLWVFHFRLSLSLFLYELCVFAFKKAF
jgi:hypothetical protein